MKYPLCEINIDTEMDVVLAHRKAIKLCKLMHMPTLGQTQVGTAVSEIARNIIEHALSGNVNFYLMQASGKQWLEIVLTDAGNGVDLLPLLSDGVIDFSHKGSGINISRKLMDDFQFTSSAQGSTITLQKMVTPAIFSEQTVGQWAKELQETDPEDLSPYEELKIKNQQLRALAKELEEKNEAFEQQVTEIGKLNALLGEKNQGLTEFAYTLSHDLKNPLSNIMLLAQMAIKRPDNSQILEKISTSALVMENIVKGLMQIVDLDQDTSDNIQELDFQQITTLLSGEYEEEISHDKATIHTDLEVANIIYIRPYLESILRNLISNAIKYQAEDRPLQITLSTRQEDAYTVLSVSDNGIGMDLLRYQPVLFKPFKRFTNRSSGKGLGLYLIKQMIEKNGGTIQVESTPDEGTTFHCYLKPYAS